MDGGLAIPVDSSVMVIVLPPQGNEWVEWAKLAATAVAAAAVIVAAVVTAKLTKRHESDSWLRARRADAYKQLLAALEASAATIVDGVGNALHHPRFDGLEEARAAALASQRDVTQATSQAIVVAGEDLMVPIARLGTWSSILYRAAPLSGMSIRPAVDQYKRCIDLMNDVHLDLALRMRSDLQAGATRPTTFGPDFNFIDELESWLQEQAEDPRGALRQWRVGRWVGQGVEEPDIEVGYVTDTEPWQHVQSSNNNLNQPMAAMLRKAPNAFWHFAISAEVSDPEMLMALEFAAANIVVKHGTDDGEDPFGQDFWIEAGDDADEQIHFWPLDVVRAFEGQFRAFQDQHSPANGAVV